MKSFESVKFIKSCRATTVWAPAPLPYSQNFTFMGQVVKGIDFGRLTSNSNILTM